MIDYVVGLRHGEICKNVVAASCISIKYGITDIFKFVVQVLFKMRIFGVFFLMRKALKTYMHDLGYKLLARKWIHILTTLSYNHNLQYTYKRDMDAVLYLFKKGNEFCLKLDISEYQPLFINGRIAINIQKIQVFVMLKNDSFKFVGASKLIKRHYFFF